MKSPQSMGMNRTGMDMAPQGVEEMLQAVREFPPTSEGTEQNLSDLRKPYLEEADPIGSVPVPGTVKGVAKSGMHRQARGPAGVRTNRDASLRLAHR
jgi:hypothetical protein